MAYIVFFRWNTLGDDARFHATYDCNIIEIYRLEPFHSHIIFVNHGFMISLLVCDVRFRATNGFTILVL